MLSKIKSLYDNEHALSFLLCMLGFGIATGLYSGVLNNYLHEVLSITRVERGIIEFPRELPGFLLLAIILILARFSELKVMYFALLISFAGMIGLSVAGDARITAIGAIVLFSTGEHILMPIRQSIAMHMTRKGKEGLAMGAIASLGNIGQVIGHYSIIGIFFLLGVTLPGITSFAKFRVIFLLGALVILVAVIIASRLNETKQHVPRRKLYFKKKFRKYYILEMFFGARKQIFLTFAPYVLILQYGAKTEYLAFLYGIWSFSNIFLNPLMGRLLDKIGYKTIICISEQMHNPDSLVHSTQHIHLQMRLQ